MQNPTCRSLLWDNRVEVLLFGKGTGDWRLQGGSPDEVEKNNPGILSRLKDIFDEFPRVQFYAPRPLEFNAEIVHPHDLNEPWGDRFWRGKEADGVILQRPRQAFLIASADCPTLIFRNYFTGMIITSHAGRDCLFDRQKLFTGTPSRKKESVIQNLPNNLVPREMAAWIFCGIVGKYFSHPWDHLVNGEDNKKISLHFGEDCLVGDPWEGRLELREVIKKQLIALGVPSWAINGDHVDTYSDREPNDRQQYRWHSARRDGPGGGRNLVVVLRHK